MSARVLVVAKAPVPGLAKTRLGRRLGHLAAGELAAAALLDTLDACAAAVGVDRCHLALAGDLDDGCRSGEIREALRSWHVFPQRGEGLGARLAGAHHDLARREPGPVVQVGADTPQLTPEDLRDAATGLRPGRSVVGPAVDGGWWLLGLAEPAGARVLPGVAMSTALTHRDTVAALSGAGLQVRSAPTLRDVDTVEDAAHVAVLAPDTRFAAAWARLGSDAGVEVG
ncbi:MAG TPA: DUF2064 domain-containing protein [Marmoricola sp.]|nr:DUF2064 domain-containing protein [Marmoricola sp.]